MKNKTKVLLTSLATIAMSASLAVGGTYALFTSEDSVNIAVTSGTVKVSAKVTDVQTGYDENVVSSANGSFVAEKSDKGVSLSGMIPGDVATVDVEITNESTVAVLYKVVVAKSGDLSEALVVESESSTWSLWEEQGTKALSLTIAFLDSDNVNAYNVEGGLSGNVSITVYAVQGNAEVSDDLPENVVPLYTKADLVDFAEAVNAGDTYKGKEVRLMSDINLAGIEWTPIGPNADETNKFAGTFDGQGHTISNLKVEQGAAYHAAGLFGALNGTLKNLTIDGATISSISSGAATDNGTAVVAGSIYSSGTIDNVHVKNATVNGNRYVGGISGYTYGNVTNCSVENVTITATPDNLTGSYDNGDKAGGIAGYWASESVYKIEGNSVKNVTITGYRDLGGIVGYGDGVAKDNSANGVTIYVNNEQNYKNYTALSEYDAGAIVGDGTVDPSNTAIGYKVYLMQEPVTVSSVDDLVSAIANANGAVTITLENGTYTTTQIAIPSDKSVTIVGSKDAVLAAQLKVVGTLTLEGVSVKGPSAAVADEVSQYSKSAIALVSSGDVICKNVTFDLSNAVAESTAITAWWSTDDGANIECYDCTFNCAGQRPIRSDACVTVVGCTFNDPYRYAVQMTSKSSTMNAAAEAYVNFYNNTINAGTTSSITVVYGVQLEGGYGCSELTINGAGNTINYGTTGKTGTMYYCECGAVEHETIVWNTEVDPVHEN